MDSTIVVQSTPIGLVGLVAAMLTLSACGGGGGGGNDGGGGTPSSGVTAPSPTTYTVGGTISGVTGTGLVLQISGSNNLTVTGNGSFTFTSPVASGGSYTVTVVSQPTNPPQTCTVANGSGTANGNISNIVVTCTLNSYTVGGTVSGLNGTGLVLQNNAGDDLPVTANGTFTFANALASGAAFNVSVKTQPTSQPAQTCAVSGGTGTVATASVTNVSVSCRTLIGHFLFVPNTGSNDVSAYSIDPSTGALTAVAGSPFTGAGTQPRVALAPSTGKFLYVTGATNTAPAVETLAGYSINSSTGVLTPIGGLPQTLQGAVPSALFHPSGNFLFINSQAGAASQALNVYKVDSSTGQLTAASGSPYSIGTVNAATFDATGANYYLATIGAGAGINAYSVDASTGALTSSGQAALTGLNPVTPVVSPSGKFLYATNVNLTVPAANNIAAFNVSSTGLGSALSGSPFASGQLPTGAYFTSTGKYLYVVNVVSSTGPSSVSAYTVDAATGALTPVAGSPFPTNGTARGTASLDPSGKYLLVTNTASGTLAIFTIDASSGALAHIAGSPFSIGAMTGSVQLDPSGRFVYVADAATNMVSVYLLNSSNDTFTLVNSYPTGLAPAGGGMTVVGVQ